MSNEKPLIAVLMAVYRPRTDWLCEQLKSLNDQTYPNIRLYVRDDGSPEEYFTMIRAMVKRCIHSFPYVIERNERNMGSNAAFELLTEEAEGDYFAYCDQDDVWLPDKLTVLQAAIEREQAVLVCSDMNIIDENGSITADSITGVRRHHVFRSGEGLAPSMLISNFATGCTVLIRADTAKAAVPFCPYMVHDHFLALYAAVQGRIASLPDRLVSYRIHGKNQTPLMSGVRDRDEYYEVRILPLINRLEWLRDRFSDDSALHREIEEALEWACAREANFRKEKGAKGRVLKGRRFGFLVSLAEVFLAGAPPSFFRAALWLAKRNMV